MYKQARLLGRQPIPAFANTFTVLYRGGCFPEGVFDAANSIYNIAAIGLFMRALGVCFAGDTRPRLRTDELELLGGPAIARRAQCLWRAIAARCPWGPNGLASPGSSRRTSSCSVTTDPFPRTSFP